MALTAFLKSLDDLDQTVAALYRQTEHGFVLDVEPAEGYALEDVSGLKSALQQERTSLEKVKKSLSKWADLSPDEVRESLAELERLRDAGPNEKAKLEAQLKAHTERVEAKYAQKLRDATERGDAATKRLERELVDRHLAEAIGEHQGLDHLLRPALRELVTVQEEEGELVVRVLEKPGGDIKFAFPKGGPHRPMTVKELVGELKADDRWANAFTGATVGGSGGSGNPGTGRVPGGAAAAKHLASLPPAARVAAHREMLKKQGGGA